MKNVAKNKKLKTNKKIGERFFANQIAESGISQIKNCVDKTRWKARKSKTEIKVASRKFSSERKIFCCLFFLRSKTKKAAP